MDRVPLEIAAERSGVLPGYHDCHGAWRAARPEVVRAALAAMGVEPDARGRYALPAPPPIDPMAVAWQDTPTQLPCRIPPDLYGDTMEVHIGTDEGAALAEWRLAGGEDRSGLSLPPLPFGYHRLRLRIGSERAESIIISAPRRAAAQGERRRWGVFLPLYALRTTRNWGAGDYTDLAALMEWAADQGAHLVGTLPLLPHPADTVSPYSPTSRLFWDEWYVDPLALPESAALPAVAAQALRAREQARAAALVQY
ncbi:MAG: 4-alpha-glucanotransferase, partial [Deltaproteobacteria bacterium]|nr:4-alpha-glucanotransferase [Deltaproteobacteria bacterium]